MNWINVNDKHFVDLNPDGTWVENNNCPPGPFLAGLWVNNKVTGTTTFQWYKVVLTEDGLEEVTDDGSFNPGWELTDFEYWAVITEPR